MAFMGAPDEEALASTLEVIQALVFASPTTKATVLCEATKLGMLEALERLEYGPGSKRLKGMVDLLVEELEAAARSSRSMNQPLRIQGRQVCALDQSTGTGRERGARGMSNKPAWMTKT